MKRKIYVSAFALLAAFGLSAQHKDSEPDNLFRKLVWDDQMLNIMLDTRFDFQGIFPSQGEKEWGFHAQTIKLWVAGEIVPGIRYRLRYRLNKPQTPLREGYSSAIDHAWVAFNIGKRKNWTITAGKQSFLFGTFEFDYNPADVYLSTMVNNDIDSYKAGISVAYRFAGQALSLQVVNSDFPQFAREDYAKKGMGLHLLWEGSLWDGAVKTRWGYGAIQHTRSKFYNWYTPGTQINIGKFVAELDYYSGHRFIDYGKQINTDDTGYRYVRDRSFSANFRYDLGKWKPAVKGVWDQRYDMEYKAKAYRNLGLQAVLEFYPFSDKLLKDLRFHVMYSYVGTDFRGPYNSRDNLGTHTALMGMRWLFKAK